MDAQFYDVVIVGGGAAGLSAALVLGPGAPPGRGDRRRLTPQRARRAHAGVPVPRRDAAGRAARAPAAPKCTGYGVELFDDQVTRIEPGFVVRLASGRVLTARRILVATGVGDELPDIPGVRERWGRDLLHCPYCHGWEVRDQPLGVLGTHPGSVLHAQLVRQWSDDVVFFAHTHDLSADEQAPARRTRHPDRATARSRGSWSRTTT